MGSIKDVSGGVLLNLKVKPGSLFNKIHYGNSEVVVNLKGLPIRGMANRELVKTLSKALNVSSDNVRIVKGLASKFKTVFIKGLCVEEVEKYLRVR